MEPSLIFLLKCKSHEELNIFTRLKNDNKQDHEDENKKETTRPRCEAWNC